MHLLSCSIDGTDLYDRLARMVNDSDHENAKMAVVEHKGKPHLCLFAVRDISIGEEVVYDYGVDDLPWHNSVCR